MLTETFTDEQTTYLRAFVAGLNQGRSLCHLGQDAEGRFTHEPDQTVFGTPLDDLCKEERIKHERNGLDCYDTILANAAANEFPTDGDIFRYKFHGLFYVSPAQDSLMLRCRVAGGALTTAQFRGLAEITRDWGNGFGDLTTRANVQIREILPPNAPNVLMKLADLGLTSQGSGADNIRNITATPTSGFDPDELIDVLPLARSLHHYILKNRDLYGLPRKFNVSYDSGGAISTCADTNDIGFYAVKLSSSAISHLPSTIDREAVFFRMQLCGITGHKQFATDCGVLLTPEETLPVTAALIRTFIEHGDRTNRNKARLKYLVDDWGIPRMLEETQKRLAFPLRYVPLEACEATRPKTKHGHLGTHLQRDGNHYLGVCVPVGRMSADQMEQLSDIADRYGRGELRLTVWQNLLIPHIAPEKIAAAQAAIHAAGFTIDDAAVQGGLVACTGSKGCKYAAADTKGNAVALGAWLQQRVPLDQPVNIHLTGCKHSCAQHYIGDIGLMGVRVKTPAGDTVDGYDIVLGGGCDDTQAVAREMWKSVAFTDIPPLLESLLKTYLTHRLEGESFTTWANRHALVDLQHLIKERGRPARS